MKGKHRDAVPERATKSPVSAPITAQDLRECSAEFKAHLRLAKGGYMVIKRCVEHPTLTVTEGRENRKAKPYRSIMVGDVECATLEEAARLLTQERDVEASREDIGS